MIHNLMILLILIASVGIISSFIGLVKGTKECNPATVRASYLCLACSAIFVLGSGILMSLT